MDSKTETTGEPVMPIDSMTSANEASLFVCEGVAA
jgi:hypothetical protein